MSRGTLFGERFVFFLSLIDSDFFERNYNPQLTPLQNAYMWGKPPDHGFTSPKIPANMDIEKSMTTHYGNTAVFLFSPDGHGGEKGEGEKELINQFYTEERMPEFMKTFIDASSIFY